MDRIEFFGQVDKDKATGKVASEYPAWYFKRQEHELREGIAQKERALYRREVAPSEIAITEAALARERARLDEITASRPVVSDAAKDAIFAAYKEAGKKVAEAMFTQAQMEKGLADPHEEVRRITEPCIDGIDPELARSCSVKVDEHGRVTREGAAKIYKILGGYLGENTNVEALRKVK